MVVCQDHGLQELHDDRVKRSVPLHAMFEGLVRVVLWMRNVGGPPPPSLILLSTSTPSDLNAKAALY